LIECSTCPCVDSVQNDWGLLAASLFIASPTLLCTSDTSITEEHRCDEAYGTVAGDVVKGSEGVSVMVRIMQSFSWKGFC
jgi:hypothetical protein